MDIFHYKLLLIYAVYTKTVNGAKFEVMKTLYNHLTTGHNKYLRPEIDSKTMTYINLDFHLLNLQEINEVDGTVSITGYFVLTWTDDNMKWNPSDFDGQDYIVLPNDQLWKPPLLNSNTAKQFQVFGDDHENYYVFVNYTGYVIWTAGENLKFSCKIDTSYFPFDSQECHMDIFSFAYPGTINLSSLSNSIYTEYYTENNEWDLTNTSVANTEIAEVRFKFIFKRKPLFLVVNLILPVVFLAMLNICVFFLPQESGERIGFSITLLLAVVVFLTIAQGMLPATAKPRLSAICIMLFIDLIISGLIVCSVIVSSWLYYKSNEEIVPSWIEKIVGFKHSDSKQNEVTDIFVEENKTYLATCTKNTQHCRINNSGADKMTWLGVAQYWDKFSLVFFIMAFIVGILSFITDVKMGND